MLINDIDSSDQNFTSRFWKFIVSDLGMKIRKIILQIPEYEIQILNNFQSQISTIEIIPTDSGNRKIQNPEINNSATKNGKK